METWMRLRKRKLRMKEQVMKVMIKMRKQMTMMTYDFPYFFCLFAFISLFFCRVTCSTPRLHLIRLDGDGSYNGQMI